MDKRQRIVVGAAVIGAGLAGFLVGNLPNPRGTPFTVPTPKEGPVVCYIDPEGVQKYKNIALRYGTVRDPQDYPVYVTLSGSIDPENPARRDIFAIVDARNIWIRTPEGERKAPAFPFPVSGEFMETMGQLGQPGMQVFYSPELVEAAEKSAFLRDKLELMFKPSNDLKPLRLTRKSREYKIINEGNPQDLLPENPTRYTLTPARLIKSE